MKTIYKYTLQNKDQQTIKMPYRSEILSLQVQNGEPCIWAKVDTSDEYEDKEFLIFGTGHHLPENPMNFIGTYQLDNGRFVFHVFEVIR